MAVDELSFNLCGNEIVGLIGVNGVGNTTAIHMLPGLIKPTAGSIRMFGENFAGSRIHSRESLRSRFLCMRSNLWAPNEKQNAAVYQV